MSVPHASIPPSEPPLLSVVVPVRDARRELEACLRSLAASHYRRFEVIVVDDGSIEPVTLPPYAAEARVLRFDRSAGPALARNAGAAAARGELLLFVDADVCVHPETLGGFVEAFDRFPEHAAIMGAYDDAPAAPQVVSRFRNLLHHFVHLHGAPEAGTFWSGCGAVRREAFEAVGGFVTFPDIEDIELGYALRRAGYRIRLVPELQATHLKRWTLARMVRTDVFRRGVPWIVLMLHYRKMGANLNVDLRSRAGTLLAVGTVATPVALAASGEGGAALASALLLLALLAAINRDLYTFFVRKRGPGFALAALPLHLLYFLCCAVSVPLGLAAWARSLLGAGDAPKPRPAIEGRPA
jgi:glycosyltransferase involved in cell wall biosynthesis